MTGFCVFSIIVAVVLVIIGNILLSRPANALDEQLSKADAELRKAGK